LLSIKISELKVSSLAQGKEIHKVKDAFQFIEDIDKPKLINKHELFSSIKAGFITLDFKEVLLKIRDYKTEILKFSNLGLKTIICVCNLRKHLI